MSNGSPLELDQLAALLQATGLRMASIYRLRDPWRLVWELLQSVDIAGAPSDGPHPRSLDPRDVLLVERALMPEIWNTMFEGVSFGALLTYILHCVGARKEPGVDPISALRVHRVFGTDSDTQQFTVRRMVIFATLRMDAEAE